METASVLNKTKWSIDPAHTQIGFQVKHLMISKVTGFFKEFEGEVSSTVEGFADAGTTVRINAASIDTGDVKRDEHLRSSDFFDTETFKEIRFTGSSMEPTGNGIFTLTGNLTMKGISKKVHLNVEFGGIAKDPWGNHKASFTIKGKINRKDWGLNWNAALEAGGVLVSDEVTIIAEVQLVKQTDAAE